MPSIVGRTLLIDKLVMNPGLSIQNVGVHPASGGWRPLYAGQWADTSNFVKHILFFKWKLIPRSGHNISHYKTDKLMIHVQK